MSPPNTGVTPTDDGHTNAHLTKPSIQPTHRRQGSPSMNLSIPMPTHRRARSSSVEDIKTEATLAIRRLKEPPFQKIMAANRGEIAVRIMRAAAELGIGTVAVYCHEDRYSQHRWGADRSFKVEHDEKATPISAYLDIPQIIEIAKDAGVDAIHPGYGFNSENADFAQACQEAGITFIGPTPENLRTFADKTSAKEAAIKAGLPIVPGSEVAFDTADQVVDFVKQIGLPVMLKASMGGGGKGMRIVRTMEELVPLYEMCYSEAKSAFGNGAIFVERYLDRPRHIEIQILGDGKGNVVHLWERDCSLQRRHQKVLEIAPAWSVPDDLRVQLHEYATRITKSVKYKNAGTVEFLIDADYNAYFCEVNPRVQVEHTVTEEITDIDVVQSQIKIAAGMSLEEIGLIQENIVPRGVAIQARVTTENPERNFAPDTGTISLFRSASGPGVRVDGIGYTGLAITPFFDSLICKFTVHCMTFYEACARMRRVLDEVRIRGVNTNIPFLLNVLNHPEFEKGIVTTGFIDENPQLKNVSISTEHDQHDAFRMEKLLRYLANIAVNGHPSELGADMSKRTNMVNMIAPPRLDESDILAAASHTKGGWRRVLLDLGPEGYAKAVRSHKGLMIMDTTWRDAHQSLLATRMRTADLLRCAEYTDVALANAFSLEMWGGATFDVSMRFLHECPWERLEKLRKAAPRIPFQMLLRGANAVGYTAYPDNVVHKFCEQAVKSGIDIFRVFDSLNDKEALRLGIDAARKAGGFVEGALSYTGDVCDPNRSKYDLSYYKDLARELVEMGVHCIGIKDMAGLLKPRAATMLISALRQQHPEIPIHVHTHDTAGSGVASMLAAAEAGADIVDVAIDAMSGMTSQPSLGAIVANLRGSDLDTGIDAEMVAKLNNYWESVRSLYAPFESGQLSGSSDVYMHEIPGGQYTNLLFQSKQLGLMDKWPEIKRKYAEANLLLGDIPKVTPSSKVVGDMAQMMVAKNLDSDQVMDQAENIPFPESVINYLQGNIGVPPGGFPEPLRSRVLKSRCLLPVEGRPGSNMVRFDFDLARALITKKVGGRPVTDKDCLSYAMYPQVFLDWKDFEAVYGDVTVLPTHMFLNPMNEGDEVIWDMGGGREWLVKLESIGDVQSDGSRIVILEVNGEPWFIPITDLSSAEKSEKHEKVSVGNPGHVGAPTSGVIVRMKVKAGDTVEEGEALATLSAMKMETVIPATRSGVVNRVLFIVGDKVDRDDLLMEIVEDDSAHDSEKEDTRRKLREIDTGSSFRALS